MKLNELAYQIFSEYAGDFAAKDDIEKIKCSKPNTLKEITEASTAIARATRQHKNISKHQLSEDAKRKRLVAYNNRLKAIKYALQES